MVKSYLQVELVKKGNHEMAESHFLKSPVNRKHAFKKSNNLIYSKSRGQFPAFLNIIKQKYHHIQQQKVYNAMMYYIYEYIVLHIAVTFVLEQVCTRCSNFKFLIGYTSNSYKCEKSLGIL